MQETLSQIFATLSDSAATISMEMLIIAGIASFGLLIHFWLGRSALVSLIIGIYPALVLSPLLASLFTFPYASMVFFIGLLFFAYHTIERLVYNTERGSGISGFLRAAVLSLSFAGVLIASTFAGLDTSEVYTFSNAVGGAFSGAGALFFWLAQPLIVVRFV